MALEIYTELGDYQDSAEQAKNCAMLLAAIYINNQDYGKAFSLLEPYMDDPLVQEAFSTIEDAYQEAVIYFTSGELEKARQRFTSIKDYKDSSSYLKMISASSYWDIAPYLDLTGAIDQVYRNSNYMKEYLRGAWGGDDCSFVINSEDKIVTDIPTSATENDSWRIKDNVCIIGVTNCFRFTIIDAFTVDIYSYKDRNTYRLKHLQ